MMKKSRGQVCLNWNVRAVKPCGRYPAEHKHRAQQGLPEGGHTIMPETQHCRHVPPPVTKRVQPREVCKLCPILLQDVRKRAYPTCIKHHTFSENTEEVKNTYKKRMVTTWRKRRKRGFTPLMLDIRFDHSKGYSQHLIFTRKKALFSDLPFTTLCLCRLRNHKYSITFYFIL